MTFIEYPKMLSRHGSPLLYPHGHERAGQLVVVHSAEEETAVASLDLVLAEPRMQGTGTHVHQVIERPNNHSAQHAQMPVGHRGETKVPHHG